MSADNGVLIKKVNDNEFEVYEFFASDEEGSEQLLEKFDDLQKALVYAVDIDSEYGVRFVDLTIKQNFSKLYTGTLLEKIIFNKQIDLQDIYIDLKEMCDKNHTYCDDDCLVYKYNEGVPYDSEKECICFKNGAAMYKFLRKFQGGN